MSPHNSTDGIAGSRNSSHRSKPPKRRRIDSELDPRSLHLEPHVLQPPQSLVDGAEYSMQQVASVVPSILSGVWLEKAPIRRHATSPKSSQEAYLLLEAANSDRVISSLKKDLAFEMVHRNVITLQLNQIMLERAEEDLNDADEDVGYVRLSIQESGCSVASEYATRESHILQQAVHRRHPPQKWDSLDIALD